ncbi:mitotic-spindle organizing protein 2 isoform X4 [Phycodurus eques]|nr:mitotic-spindle organizing protein 2 isoform X4 [Phycodurus eques]
MNVAPQAVFQTLKAMCAGQRVPESSDGGGGGGGGIPSAKAEARDESSSSGKNPKMPAGAPAAPGPRSARVGAKMAAYGGQDVGSAPHAQGLAPVFAFSSAVLAASMIARVCATCLRSRTSTYTQQCCHLEVAVSTKHVCFILVNRSNNNNNNMPQKALFLHTSGLFILQKNDNNV